MTLDEKVQEKIIEVYEQARGYPHLALSMLNYEITQFSGANTVIRLWNKAGLKVKTKEEFNKELINEYHNNYGGNPVVIATHIRRDFKPYYFLDVSRVKTLLKEYGLKINLPTPMPSTSNRGTPRVHVAYKRTRKLTPEQRWNYRLYENP